MLPPAVAFLKRAFAEPRIIKGIICHGMWLVAPAPELVRGRRVVAHINLLGDVRNMGAIYTDEDVVVDETARRKGIGQALVRHAIELARAAGADGVSLTSNRQREAANQLYQSMGFQLRQTNPYFYRLK